MAVTRNAVAARLAADQVVPDAPYQIRGRIIVAICHNMDLGDGWENSDDPKYEEKWASLAYRVGMNYFVYDLTH